ncbi:hypothetical protein ACS8YF_12575 [Salinisphaera sp. SWV1]|uniref:hypothetical protein n=1 Tax=Salinisphaera sp. SWV1 TaxID=3454139 RepID=UPI003F87D942
MSQPESPTKEQIEADIRRERVRIAWRLVRHFRKVLAAAPHGQLSLEDSAFLLASEFPPESDAARQLHKISDSPSLAIEIQHRMRRAYSLEGDESLKPVNRNALEAQWRYPIEHLVSWARRTGTGNARLAEAVARRANIPLDLAAARNKRQDSRSARYTGDRELVLGAALAVLGAKPDSCRTESGRINASAIVRLIQINGMELFADKTADGAPPLGDRAMRKVISEWLDNSALVTRE